MWATCGISVDKGVDALWIACGRDVDGIGIVAGEGSVGTVGKLPTRWGKPLVYKQFSRVCKHAYAASLLRRRTCAPGTPKTTSGRPLCADAPKSLGDKGCATGGRAA